MKNEGTSFDREKLQQAADRARLAEHVYTPKETAPEGWRLFLTSEDIIPVKTGFFAALYEKLDPKPGETTHIVAFRGVDDMRDLQSIMSIFARRVPKQYKMALEFMDYATAAAKVAPQDMEMTGHSLGGYLARTVGAAVGVKRIWAFNSPGPTASVRAQLAQQMLPKLPHDAVIHIRSKDDVISKWGYDDGIAIEVETQGNYHNLAVLRKTLAAISEAAEQKHNEAAKPEVEKLSIMSVFNAVSRKVCRSPAVQEFIHGLFGPPQQKPVEKKPNKKRGPFFG